MGYAPPAWVNYGLTNEDNMPSREDEDRRNAPKVRVARITGGADHLALVEPYLPSNYGAVKVYGGDIATILIVGYDNAGWTLDGYVQPRLASGLIFAEEVR